MFKLGFHNPDEELADKIALNTSDGNYTIRTVACFGQCALAPVVEVNHEVYGHMNEQTLQRELKHLERESGKEMTRIRDLSTFSTVRGAGMAKLLPFRPRIAVGMGTCGAGNGAEAVFHAFADAIDKRGSGYPSGPRRLLWFLRAGAAGERLAARPAAGNSPPGAEQAHRRDPR